MKTRTLLGWLALGMWGFRNLSGQTFTDVGQSAGVRTFLNSHGSGFFDTNADGWDDLFIIHNVSMVPSDTRDNAFFRNLGNGTFSDITNDIHVKGEYSSNQGLAAGDYGNDHRLDMAVGMGDLPNYSALVYHQLGDGTFNTTGAGMIQHNAGRCLSFVDYDNDGWVDLFICGARTDYPYLLLYRNNHNDTFTDQASYAGIRHSRSPDDVFGFAFGDMDNDGDMDLFLPNKHLISRFFINNGNGTFTERYTESGLPGDSLYCGAVWLDYNNDGYLDLFCRKYPTAPVHAAQLFRNNGNGTFTNVSSYAGVSQTTDRPGFGGGLSVADFNNDGYEDILIISKGSVTNKLFRNNGDGTFTNIVADAKVNIYSEYWSAPIADYNHDGYLDIYFCRNGIYAENMEHNETIVGTPSFYASLYRNNGGTNHWLHVLLQGVQSNWFAIGARAVAWVDGLRQTRQVRGGDGYKVDSFPVEFGLGTSTFVDSLIIHWPSGILQKCIRIQGDQRITILEEEGTRYYWLYQLSGEVGYGQTSFKLPSVDIAMTGFETHNAETDELGYYVFPEVKGDGQVFVTPSKPRFEDVGSSVVSAYDAVLTARHASGLKFITGVYPLRAADADESGTISIYDAALILRYSVGLAAGGNSRAGSWRFDPPSRTYPWVDSDLTGQNLVGIVIGDVDQDWAPAGPGKRIPGPSIAGEFRTVRTGDTVSVSLDVPEGYEWLSSDAEFTFDPEKLRFLGIAKADGFEKASCLFNEPVPGTVRVGAYSAEPIKKSGSWGSARFLVLVPEGGSAVIVWNSYRINNLSFDRGLVSLSAGVSANQELPDFRLDHNYPNPFNPETRIEYRIRTGGQVRFVVFDLVGRSIRTLVNHAQEAGVHTVVWDGKDDVGQETPSGMYVARLWSGPETATLKMIKTR